MTPSRESDLQQIEDFKKKIAKLRREIDKLNSERSSLQDHIKGNFNKKKVDEHKRTLEPFIESNEFYRSIIETANEGIWISNANIQTIFVNQRLADMLGYSRDEILGKSPFSFMDEDAVMIAKKYSERRKQGHKDNYEQKYIRKDGSVLWALVAASPMYDNQSNFVAYIGMLTDITQRKLAEEALRESEEKFSAAFKSNPNALVLSSVEDGTIVDVNDTFLSLFERTKDEVIGRTSSSLDMFVNPLDRDKAIAIIRRDGRVVNFEIKIKRGTGEERIALLSVEILHITRGKTMLTTIQDITDRKQSENKIQELLRLSERRSAELNAVIECMPDAVYIGTREGITQCNTHALQMLGAGSLQDLQNRIGELALKFNVRWPDSGRLLREDELQFSRALKGETVIEEVLATNAQTGEDVYIRAADAPVSVNGEIIGAVAINSDVTERRKVENALRHSEKRLKAIFDNLTEGLITVDPVGRVLEWNPAALRMHGYKRLESKLDFVSKVSEIFETTSTDGKTLPSDQWPIYRMMRGEQFNDYPMYIRNKEQGWKKLFSYSGTLVRDSEGNPFLGFLSIRDITEIKKAEDALLKSSEELRTITTNSPDVIARFDRHMRHTFINPYGEKVYGKTQEQIIGKSSAELGMPLEMVALWKKHFDEVLVTGEQKNVEFEFDSPTFGHQYFLSIFVPEKDNKGQVATILAITRDITKIKRSEEELRKSEEKYRELFTSMNEAAAIIEPVRDAQNKVVDYVFHDVNPTWERISGISKAHAIGKTAKELFHVVEDYWLEIINQVINTGEPVHIEEYGGGMGRYYAVTFWKMGGNRCAHTFTDITERRIAKESLQRNTTILKQAETMANLGAWGLELSYYEDVNKNPLHWSDQVYRIFGYEPGSVEVTNDLFFSHVHPEDREKVSEAITKAINERSTYKIEHRVTRADGVDRIVVEHGEISFDNSGKPIRVTGAVQDITEQKLAEQKLHEALSQAEEGRNTLNAIMEYIPMGITIADVPDVNIRMVSRYGQELLEKSNEEIAGIPAPEHPSKWGVYRSDGITPGTPEELPLSRATLQGEIVKNEEWFVTRKDGTLVPILCNAAPILDKDNKVVGGIIAWQDIAELKRIQREMQHRNEELTRFIYTVSHDLKSPLVTIKMFTSYLRDDINDKDDAAQDEDLGYIENAADKMGKLLDELLELSRIGRKEQVKSEVLLETITKAAIDLVAGRIRKRKVNVHVTAPRVLLYGYGQRLTQLYQNLLDNAVKFMGNQPEPMIEIGAFVDKNNEVVLFVRDNGSGIDPRYQHKLFGLFEKLDPNTEGTGIGLALVKRIIEVHEGRIWVISEGKDKGTTFYFTLEKTKILNDKTEK